MNTYLIIGTLATLITIVGGVFAALKWGKATFRKVWHWLTRRRPRVPRETIRILPQLRGHWWEMGSSGDQPAMHVHSRWYVTNIIGDPVLLLGTRIVRPHIDGVVSIRDPKDNIFGRYPILPGATTEVCTDFIVKPPILEEGQDFKTTVILIDQLGNEHKVKNVVFKGPKPKEPKKAEPPKESIHAISDPIEKEIVAVLKAEVNRYRECGRRVGGLGSVRTTYKGQTTRGVGTEWRIADSPENQSIILDVDTAKIVSDNTTALLKLYRKLRDDEERERFVAALLKRLSRSTEYAPVGYLILLVLFRIDRLSEALNTAKRDLHKDGAHGFSDLLRLLDGLLRFEHSVGRLQKPLKTAKGDFHFERSTFTPALLDEVERFVEGLDEDTFHIQERVAAIRVYRLATQPNVVNIGRIRPLLEPPRTRK